MAFTDRALWVCMWPMNVCWKLCINQNLCISAQNSQPPAIFSGLLLNKIFLYPSTKLSVSWLYCCSDVERLVAGWPCFWFYGRGQLWQQRGVATLHSVVRLLLRWSEVQCQFYSTWEAVNVCHLLCDSLDPQGRLKEINAWQEEQLRLKRKAKLCEIHHWTRICNLGLDQWP